MKNQYSIGEQMYRWAEDLFPINRSITGPGVRETLAYFKKIIPDLVVYEVPTGTKAFDWTVPDEWTIRDAYIADESGKRVVDFQLNNLHIVGYSEPIDMWLNRDELDRYLYSLPDKPDAIPYVTSYYFRRWGFCLTHKQRTELPDGRYHVVVDSEIKAGFLNYAELVIQGDIDEEVFLSTYICHPSMANNELSGPVVTLALANWLKKLKSRRYTYRIVFVPETIGSIVYISRNIDHLKSKVVAGFNVTCIGDERCYSYLPSRAGDAISDQIAQHVLHHISPDYNKYTWLDRGSDERQYCSPGIDLPIASVMRSMYGKYPEYHTSLDNLDFVTPKGLEGGFVALRRCLEIMEKNCYVITTVLCEPQLGKRGLYPIHTTEESYAQVRAMTDLISYSDGTLTLLEIANLIGEPLWKIFPIVDELVLLGLLLKEYDLNYIKGK